MATRKTAGSTVAADSEWEDTTPASEWESTVSGQPLGKNVPGAAVIQQHKANPLQGTALMPKGWSPKPPEPLPSSSLENFASTVADDVAGIPKGLYDAVTSPKQTVKSLLRATDDRQMPLSEMAGHVASTALVAGAGKGLQAGRRIGFPTAAKVVKGAIRGGIEETPILGKVAKGAIKGGQEALAKVQADKAGSEYAAKIAEAEKQPLTQDGGGMAPWAEYSPPRTPPPGPPVPTGRINPGPPIPPPEAAASVLQPPPMDPLRGVKLADANKLPPPPEPPPAPSPFDRSNVPPLSLAKPAGSMHAQAPPVAPKAAMDPMRGVKLAPANLEPPAPIDNAVDLVSPPRPAGAATGGPPIPEGSRVVGGNSAVLDGVHPDYQTEAFKAPRAAAAKDLRVAKGLAEAGIKPADLETLVAAKDYGQINQAIAAIEGKSHRAYDPSKIGEEALNARLQALVNTFKRYAAAQ